MNPLGKKLLRCACAGILVSLALACTPSSIHVRIVNSTGAPLPKMTLSYEGGTRTVENLKPGGSRVTRIKPAVSSSLTIEMVLPGGEKKMEKIRAGLDPGYYGDLKLEVFPDGRIGWEKHLTLRGSPSGRGSLTPAADGE